MYEVNTWVWLDELSRNHGRWITLGDVPTAAWDEITVPGVDAVWLMGVWERSETGRRIAMADEGLRASFRQALPDLRPQDVIGSPFCVRRYIVDERLGGPDALAVAREELARRDVRLLLDYVPNHTAPDHPWLREQPDAFVGGTARGVARVPEAFIECEGLRFARGGDPYSPPWRDVVQLNAFSPRMRQATVETLCGIGDQCDGVRCDMAMLLVNDAFAKTWGELAGPMPAEEFWPHVIGRVRERQPEMLFVAEVYGELDWALQQQGFDFCYDKTLYDRLLGGDASSVRAHLQADAAFQRRLVRFLENHDEPRAASTLQPVERECAAAVVLATLPGLTLWHEGQFDGRRARLPVFLARRPFEPRNAELHRFHLALLSAVSRTRLRAGEWRVLDCVGWPDNQSCQNLVAWCWQEGLRRHVVVANLSDRPSQARLALPWAWLEGRCWRMVPVLGGDAFERGGDEMRDPGLFVALGPWGWHVLALED
ncbi:MAG: hypothetical protein ACOYBY_13085 [Dermatophilaceae bacterium]